MKKIILFAVISFILTISCKIGEPTPTPTPTPTSAPTLTSTPAPLKFKCESNPSTPLPVYEPK